MIALAEERGFDAAPIKAFTVDRQDQETRNNDRVIVDDFDLAKRIWSPRPQDYGTLIDT